MDLSIFLARLVGVTMVVLYGGFLLNRKFYNYESIAKQPFVLLLSGIVALVFGQLLIMVHPVWTADWKVIITLFGWLLFISGILRLIFPRLVLRLADYFSRHPGLVTVLSLLFLLLGLYLVYIGYVAK